MNERLQTSAVPSQLVCDACGKVIEQGPGTTIVGSTDGRSWHYGCSPGTRSRTPASCSPDVVEKIATRLQLWWMTQKHEPMHRNDALDLARAALDMTVDKGE